MELSEALIGAVRDYRQLLDRGYPENATRALVGDRYRLSGAERTVLYRGVHSREESERRAAKRCSAEVAWTRGIRVDTLNVLYTIAAYRLGRPVFVATDGWLRDAGEAHGEAIPDPVFADTLDLLGGYVDARIQGGGQVAFLVDSLADIAGPLCRLLGAHVNAVADGRARLVSTTSVDGTLASAGAGAVATSDSRVIDRCAVAVCDLPAAILAERFKKGFVDLRSLV